MTLPTYVYDSRTQLTSPIFVLYTEHNVQQLIEVMFNPSEHQFLIITKTKMHGSERDPFRVYKPTVYTKKREVENQNFMLSTKCTNLKHSLKIVEEKNDSLSKINKHLIDENKQLRKEMKV